jgi:hypothetical protein
MNARPFSRALLMSAGWFAVAKVGRTGMSSGPWDTETQAQAVADVWNAATEVGVHPRRSALASKIETGCTASRKDSHE